MAHALWVFLPSFGLIGKLDERMGGINYTCAFFAGSVVSINNGNHVAWLHLMTGTTAA